MDPRRRPRVAFWAIAALALGLYAIFLACYIGAIPGGSDQSGYFNHAKLLASGHAQTAQRVIPGQSNSYSSYLYCPLGFRPVDGTTRMAPTYPVGLPLFLVAASPLAGWTHAGDFVLIVHALAGIVLTYLLGRAAGLGRRGSVIAASIVGASPLYLFMSLQAMSDVPALVWTTAAVIAAWKAREQPLWSWAAGVAYSIAVLLRPSDALAIAPLALLLGGRIRRWIWFGIGGVPGAAVWSAESYAAYGSAFTTGYGNQQSAFTAHWVALTLPHYLHWIPILLTPVVLLAAGLPFLRDRRTAWIFGVWIGVFFGFYSAYVCTHETWWYLRFLLPAVPVLVVAALAVGRQFIGDRRDRPAWFWNAATGLALLSVLMNSLYQSHRLRALSIGSGELKYETVAKWTQQNVPKDAVILTMEASGTLFYYTDFILVRYDMVQASQAATLEHAVETARRPLYAVLFPFEKDEVLLRRFPGKWQQVGTVRDVTIWRRDKPSGSTAVADTLLPRTERL